MPQTAKAPEIRAVKKSFSAKAYLMAAAKRAAGSDGEFSEWMQAAMREKLQRENPGLIEQIRTELAAKLPDHSSGLALASRKVLDAADKPNRASRTQPPTPR